MGFPDRIERTLELAHPPAKVWAALAGGPTVDMRVERVEEPTVFGFTWPIFGLPEDGYRRAYDGNTEGWAKELAELAAYLDAA
jgi:hypothetical protein